MEFITTERREKFLSILSLPYFQKQCLFLMIWIRKNRIKGDIQQLTDEELIQSYKDTGKEMYVATLFLRYIDKIYLIAQDYMADRAETKDMVMIVFEKVLKNLKKTEVQSFKNWVHTIVKNECHYHYRTRNNQSKKLKEWSETERKSLNSVESNPLLHLIEEEKKKKRNSTLTKALNTLNEKQRICIQLLFFEQKSYKEIAQITGFSDKEIKSHIQNGKKNLKKILSKEKE